VAVRSAFWMIPLLAAGLVACGTSDSDRFSLTTPGTDDPVVRELPGSAKVRKGKPTRAEVAVIRGWADALRAGHVEEATDFFAIPAVVADGTNPTRSLGDRAAVKDFNSGLPCGARLIDTSRGESSFVIATFRLTDRPGGQCGTGVDHLASTAFLIERKHIVQWRRGPDPVEPATKKKTKKTDES
jgi:hypothetical protein